MRIVAIGLVLACLVGTNLVHAQTQTPSADSNAEGNGGSELPRSIVDPDTLLATDEEKAAAAKAEADAKQAAMLAELDKQLLGSWGRISSRGAAGISDASIVTGVNQCLRTRRISNPDYAADAEKILPEDAERRGNIVFYRTKKGLQRLDTALRQVFLISQIGQRPPTGNRPKVWQLGTTSGAVLVGFGTIRRKGRQFPVLVEQNAIYIRCTRPGSDG